MPKVVINNSQGLVQQTGSGFEVDSSISLSSLPTTSVVAKSAVETIGSPGVYTLSSSTGALTMVMPTAASVPGGTFVFRSTSAHAHALTGSQEVVGTKVFAGQAGATPDTHGSNLALASAEGSSVALISDGKSFLVMAASGSCVISGL